MLRIAAIVLFCLLTNLCPAALGAEVLSPHLNHPTLIKPTSHIKTPIRIAIIIDDIGYHRERGKAAAMLPGAVTLAVIPHSPHGRYLANLGNSQTKEIMLHVPMSNILDKPLDAGALTPEMPYGLFMHTLLGGLNSIPHVKGVNNHMGSLLTQQTESMRWLMQALKSRDLYFVDSRTTAKSVAWEIAQEEQLPSLKRDYFLDNEQDYTSIAAQFAGFLKQTKQHGQGIAIAHPYPETLRFLQGALPVLALSGVQLVPVSDLLSSESAVDFSRQKNLQRPNDGPLDYIGPFRPR